MIKGSIQLKDITFVNMYASNTGAHTMYTKQILTDLKKEIDSSTIIVGEFNTPLTSMERSPRQNIRKETLALTDMLDQMCLTDIYRIFHTKETKYTFSNSHEIFDKADHMLGQKNNPQ